MGKETSKKEKGENETKSEVEVLYLLDLEISLSDTISSLSHLPEDV